MSYKPAELRGLEPIHTNGGVRGPNIITLFPAVGKFRSKHRWIQRLIWIKQTITNMINMLPELWHSCLASGDRRLGVGPSKLAPSPSLVEYIPRSQIS